MSKNTNRNRQDTMSTQLPEWANNKPWWKLDKMTCLFLGGLILMNIAFFLSPESLDAFANFFKRVFDIRRWPWWYFIVVVLTGWFIWKWREFYTGVKDDEYDELDYVYIARYMRMNVVVGFDLWLLVFCHAGGMLSRFYYVTKQWFGYNQYSHLALILFVGAIVLGGTTFYVVKDWLTAELGKRGRL